MVWTGILINLIQCSWSDEKGRMNDTLPAGGLILRVANDIQGGGGAALK